MEIFEEMEEKYVETNGTTLHTVIIGKGEPIVMIHGAPDFWYGWKNLILGLKDEFKIIAPDTRGINLSEHPEGVEHYALKTLVDDIKGLTESLQLGKFTLVGHDFGGIISWTFAGLYPELLKKLVIINQGHILTTQNAFVSNKEQREASSYVQEFFKPGIEKTIAADNYKEIRDFGMFDNKTEFDEEKYLEVWKKPHSLKNTFTYYKAVFQNMKRGTGFKEWSGEIKVPTLVFHGMKDTKVLPIVLEGLDEYIKDLKIIRIDHADHWVMDAAPEVLIPNIRDFIKS